MHMPLQLVLKTQGSLSQTIFQFWRFLNETIKFEFDFYEHGVKETVSILLNLLGESVRRKLALTVKRWKCGSDGSARFTE